MKKMDPLTAYIKENKWEKIGNGGTAGMYSNGHLFLFCDGTSWIVSKTPDQSQRYARSWKNMLPAMKFADSKIK